MQISHPLVFLRHGETVWNQAGRYQGIEDIPLAETGFDDARQNAALLKRLIADGLIDGKNLTLVSSPLTRAQETANEIARLAGLSPPVPNPAFREISVGHWAGLTTQQVKERYYEERKSRKLNRWTFRPQAGESMQIRCQIIKQALASVKPDTVVVTHSVVMRILWHVLGGLPEQTASQLTVPHIGLLYWNGNKLKQTDKHGKPA